VFLLFIAYGLLRWLYCPTQKQGQDATREQEENA
jgi:hypothetical protein